MDHETDFRLLDEEEEQQVVADYLRAHGEASKQELLAALQLRSRLKVDQGCHDLVFSGKVRVFPTEDGDIRFTLVRATEDEA